MTHHLFLADNNIADFQIPAFDIGTEVIPPPKENETAAQNELSFVSNKLFISFGVMIICAIIITCLLVLFRRKIQNNQVVVGNTAEIVQEEYQPEKRPHNDIKLGTPSSIKECIISFLENTKND